MDYGMQGKVALVIGGGGGSGRITSTMFAQEGVKVVVADISEEAGQETVNIVKAVGGEAYFIKCDVTSEEDIKAAVNFAVETYGGLNFAINIVGTNTDFTDITQVPAENFDKMFYICTRSTYLGMKYQIPAMIKSGGGSIVNMASAGGLVGQRKQGLYNAAKFAVVGMTKAAALDFAAQGVRINCVCPGPMLSIGMKKALEKDPHFGDQYLVDVPIGRFIGQDEVAAACVFLCSEKAAAITGIALPVDGGMVAD
ncbi:SDR family oxidoreductase [Calorimonas adulescens]|jgi:short chain dehydrogenase.|uniref:SDR family oxidoreductase n=1 Tax=Calorimonas adulescens TaxID=2606906 RepID=A0A5D8QE37_9THEO|nr:SDR family oxidoreductase [Calorimonas adulescens]TZE82439.1 SDR family oxidoreductase [Calorimonas adulescens]